MSNPEATPQWTTSSTDEPCAGIEILGSRAVPLGGPRAMTVRRTLPQKRRSLIGAWCFVDHYGPDDVSATGGMAVPRHPHTGLQTVSWLFTGRIEHLDSAGHHAFVLPGELNLMTAGHGISHSEFSTPDTTVLHGAQLWTVLPDSARDTGPRFEHYRPEPVRGEGWETRVFLGSFAGDSSPIATATPLLGVELRLEPGTAVEFEVEPDFEHGVLLDSGGVEVAGHPLNRGDLAFCPAGHASLALVAGDSPTRLLLLGGTPFDEEIIMWWNFIGRTHEEIAAFRAQWQEEIGQDRRVDPTALAGSGNPADSSADLRYGTFPAGEPAPLPAPRLPNSRLRPRTRPRRGVAPGTA